mmetsp:Transcript_12397/g.31683  ORF Transcript_12397/g.31683 Transcript_12397/m.31683 type:complete len:98 (-) Transcript_12397:912-1205(-)
MMSLRTLSTIDMRECDLRAVAAALVARSYTTQAKEARTKSKVCAFSSPVACTAAALAPHRGAGFMPRILRGARHGQKRTERDAFQDYSHHQCAVVIP